MASKANRARKASAASRGRSARPQRAAAPELWRARVHDPRIEDVQERVANITRATKRIKSDVAIDILRSRRGR